MGRLTSRPYECALLPPNPSRTKSRRSHRTCGAAQVSGSIPPARGASRRRSRGVPPTPAIAPGCLLHSALAEVVLDALRTTSLPQRMGTIGAAGPCCEGWPMRPPCNPFCQRPLARGEAGGVPLADARDASRGERRGEKPFPLSAPHGIGASHVQTVTRLSQRRYESLLDSPRWREAPIACGDEIGQDSDGVPCRRLSCHAGTARAGCQSLVAYCPD